jgi:hypothetical protein
VSRDDLRARRPDSHTIATVAALTRCGFTDRDRRHLRFFFEASSLRAAVELAEDLRRLTSDAVRVQPAPLRLLTRRRWTVTLTTPPAPLTLGAIQLWEAEMRGAVRRRPASRLVRWKPLLTLEDAERIGELADGPGAAG